MEDAFSPVPCGCFGLCTLCGCPQETLSSVGQILIWELFVRFPLSFNLCAFTFDYGLACFLAFSRRVVEHSEWKLGTSNGSLLVSSAGFLLVRFRKRTEVSSICDLIFVKLSPVGAIYRMVLKVHLWGGIHLWIFETWFPWQTTIQEGM
jgi:hypothetical protein